MESAILIHKSVYCLVKCGHHKYSDTKSVYRLVKLDHHKYTGIKTFHKSHVLIYSFISLFMFIITLSCATSDLTPDVRRKVPQFTV